MVASPSREYRKTQNNDIVCKLIMKPSWFDKNGKIHYEEEYYLYQKLEKETGDWSYNCTEEEFNKAEPTDY